MATRNIPKRGDPAACVKVDQVWYELWYHPEFPLSALPTRPVASIAAYQALVADLKAGSSLTTPILVWSHFPDRPMEIKRGFNRAAAALEAGWETVPVLISWSPGKAKPFPLGERLQPEDLEKYLTQAWATDYGFGEASPLSLQAWAKME